MQQCLYIQSPRLYHSNLHTGTKIDDINWRFAVQKGLPGIKCLFETRTRINKLCQLYIYLQLQMLVKLLNALLEGALSYYGNEHSIRTYIEQNRI